MGRFFKIFVVFGLSMGLLALGFMFLDTERANNAAKKPESGHKTVAQVEADAYQQQIAKFQREFPTLKKTMPNLRWFDDQVSGEGADALETIDLVTPFGPCISMAGLAVNPKGYDLLFTEDMFDPKRPSKFIGGPSLNRADAVHTAEEYCHQWYVTESNNPASPARARPLWFTPDPEAVPLPASPGEGQGNPAEPNEEAAPVERIDPSRTPAPIERSPPSPN
jgi:hypothetical protein